MSAETWSDREADPLNGSNESSGNKSRNIWSGPAKVHKLHVTEFMKSWQRFPEALVGRMSKWTKILVLCLFWLSWFLMTVFMSRKSVFCIAYEEADTSSGDNDAAIATATATAPQGNAVPLLSCGSNKEFWIGPAYKCGLDARDCTENLIGSVQSFRCPGNCIPDGRVYEPWFVGNYTAMREHIVIGGPEIYRGDSSICNAALHAGVISPYTGGSGRVEWIGPHTGFTGTPGKDVPFNSFEFDSDFPLNFRFVKDTKFLRGCKDHHIAHTVINILYILMAAYFIPAATSPGLFLGTLGVFGFWTKILACDVPLRTGTPELNNALVSEGIRRLLPCALGLVFVYYFAAKPQLLGMHASLSRLIFWGGGFTIGILENIVFQKLPIDRLIISDLNSQPGAWLALGILIAIMVVIVLGQAYSFWLCGKFPKYIKVYIGMCLALVVLAFWPGQTLRLHHFFFALLLLPGTSLQTTCSLFYQGLLVGLYIAGVARWDFASVLETAEQLSRGAALKDRLSVPKLLEPETGDVGNVTTTIVRWEQQQQRVGIKGGYSLLINDVERARKLGTPNNAPGTNIYSFNFTDWVRSYYGQQQQQNDVPDKWYVRIAATMVKAGHQLEIGEYTEPLVVHSNGSYEL